MKIILVTPRLDQGGGQRYISEIANYWASLNHDIIIVVLRSHKCFFKISKNIQVVKIGNIDDGKIHKWKHGINMLFKLRKIIKKNNPDFVLSIVSSTNIFTLIATLFLDIKIYVRDVMSPFRVRSKMEVFFRKYIYRNAAGVITMTNTAKLIIQKETQVKNIQVIPNPVKQIKLDKSIKKEKIILNIGRLISEKGQIFLLNSFARIDVPDWKLVIVGDGYLREKLEKQIKFLGLENQVIMVGGVGDIDIWLNRSSIFAFSSVSEGWGIALAEAMSAGIPCVSFDCNVGPRDMITNGVNGFLVPVRNEYLFAERIKQLMTDEALREEISNRLLLDSQRFSIEKIGKKTLDFCLSN